MKQKETRKRNKLPYEKPVMRVVTIADGVQTLGVGCKTTSNTNVRPGTAPCAPISGTPCFQPGS